MYLVGEALVGDQCMGEPAGEVTDLRIKITVTSSSLLLEAVRYCHAHDPCGGRPARLPVVVSELVGWKLNSNLGDGLGLDGTFYPS